MEIEIPYLSVRNFADRHGIHPKSVHRRIRAGEIPSVLFSGQRWIPVTFADAYKPRKQGERIAKT